MFCVSTSEIPGGHSHGEFHACDLYHQKILYICHLFVSHAALALNSIYNRYGGSVGSIQSLKDAIVSQFFDSWLFLSDLFVLSFVVKLLLLLLKLSVCDD